MLPFRKILFPVDYSASCQAVIPHVREMARRFSAELTAVHAYEPLSAISHRELLATEPDLQHKAHALEEDRLRQFAAQAFPEQDVECFAQLGEPGSVIDRFVQEQRADLVMLATRGHGPVRRLLLGSVTAKVLHDVSAAVWTGVGADQSTPYKSVLCAVGDLHQADIDDEAESVLRAAASIASAYGAKLWIVHVVPTSPAYPDIDLEAHTRKLTEESQFKLRELMAKTGVDAPHSVIDALLADGIHQEVARRSADLLITGRGGAAGKFGRLWSHLYSIIRDSACPVLSV